MAKEIRMAVLTSEGRIYPCIEGILRPGPILAVSPINHEPDRDYQIMSYFHRCLIQVPPLHTWPEGWAINQPEDRVRSQGPLETIRMEPTAEPYVLRRF